MNARWVLWLAAPVVLGCTARSPFANEPEPVFACRLLEGEGRHPFGVAVGDWNEDGRTDLAASYTQGGTTIFSAGAERVFAAGPLIPSGPVSRGIAAGDIDGDHHLDLVVANANSWSVTILRGDGKGGFAIASAPYSGVSPFHAYLAQLDDDPRYDLVVPNETNSAAPDASGTVSVFLNLSIDEKQRPTLLTAGSRPAAVAIANFDEQAGDDLAVVNWGSGTLSLFRNLGKGRFGPAESSSFGGQLPYGVATGDFNRDGKADLAITDIVSASVFIVDGDGQGHFAPGRRFAAGSGVRHVAAGDLNNDGILDLATANTAAGTVSVLIGHGDGTFAAPRAVPVGPSPRVVMLADVDGDGRQDVITSLLGAREIAVLYQTDDGEVSCPSTVSVGDQNQ